MGWGEGYIAVDWGTSNRRAYAVDGTGAVEQAVEDGLGIMKLAPKAMHKAVAALRRRFGERPMLLAGMIGSDRGWRGGPHVPRPAGAAGIAAGIRRGEPGPLRR